MNGSQALVSTELRPWKVETESLLFSNGDRVSVFTQSVRLPDGTLVPEYLRVEMRSFALIFAETRAGQILCFRQYKHGPRRIGLTLPAGGIERNEDPLAAAQRELLEETGHTSAHWRLLGRFAVSGNQGCGECFIFSASGCERTADELHSDDLEEMCLELKSPGELRDALLGGEFTIASHAAAAALGLLRR